MNGIIESRCGVCCTKCNDACRGCFTINDPEWGTCEVKHCCEDMGYQYCGECSQFPCDYYADEHNKIRIAQTCNWIANNIQFIVKQKYDELQPMTSSKVVTRIATKIMKSFPDSDDAEYSCAMKSQVR